MSNLFGMIRQIYGALSDEISRKIFIARLDYSATGDGGFVEDIPWQYRNINADI